MSNANKEIYDANWEDWHDMKIYGPASRWLRYLIVQCVEGLGKEKISSLADVGCGEGTTTAMLAGLLPGARVTGIDFSETGIALASRAYKSPNLHFAFDPNSDNLTPGAHDVVTCFEVLEHVDDWEALLQRICMSARLGVILSFPTGRMRPYEVNVGHVRNFAKGQVEAFMEKQGFVPARIFYAGFPFYSPMYRDLCNRLNVAGNSFSRGRYGFKQKAVGTFIYSLFRFLSLNRKGDQFCGAFERKAAG